MDNYMETLIKSQEVCENLIDFIYPLDDNKLYYVAKNTLEIYKIDVLKTETLTNSDTLRIICRKDYSCTKSCKIVQIYAGDEGVSGWNYDTRPQSLFNTLEECLDNMKEIVEYYTKNKIDKNTDVERVKYTIY